MCPSYRATGEEEHSTRGRARLLFEMLQGDAITDGWRSTDVRDALDLCLACKGCKSDCPVNVDMATYKAEFLSHHYRRRLRPTAHYSMGWIPLWARMAATAPGAVNAVTHARGLATAVKVAGGVDRHRDLPRFADRTVHPWFRQPSAAHPRGAQRHGGAVARHLHQQLRTRHRQRRRDGAGSGRLRRRGAHACRLLRTDLDIDRPARRRQTRPAPHAYGPAAGVAGRHAGGRVGTQLRGGIPIGPARPAARRRRRAPAGQQTYTLGQLLRAQGPDWHPPRHGGQPLIQQHCHQHAVLRYTDERDLLNDAGVATDILDAGCCGLAGNFGFESGHYDVSVACAEDKLLPAIRDAGPDTLIFADGFSCRTQIRQLAPGRRPVHIAQLLAATHQR